MSTLGPYDYWAIEYGYRELAPERGSGRARAHRRPLERARSSRSWPTTTLLLQRPRSARQHVRPRHRSARLRRAPAQARRASCGSSPRRGRCKAGENYALLRRNFTRGLFEVQQSALQAAKYIGGLTLHSDHAGSGRAPLSRCRRRSSAQRSTCSPTTVFAADSFRFSPAFLSRLAISDFDIDDARGLGRSVPTVDVAVDQQVLDVQRSVLAPLLGPEIAQRLLNNELKVSDPEEALRARRAVRDAARRDLERARQRARTSRSSGATCSASTCRASRDRARAPGADHAGRRARAAARRCDEAARRARRGAEAERGLSTEARAHLAESLATLDEALKAPLMRQSAVSAGWRSAPQTSVTLAPLDNRALANLTGPLDANLRQIEAALDVAITHRGGVVHDRRRPDAGRARGAKRCSASTPRRRSRCRSTTSSSAWSRSRRAQRRTGAGRRATTGRRRCTRAAPTCTGARRTRSRT